MGGQLTERILPQFTVSLRRASEVPDLATRWLRLQLRAEVSFFLSWDWIGCWLAETGVAAWVLEARDSERIVALAVFVPQHRRRRLLIGVDGLMLHQTGDTELDSITIEHNNVLLDRGVAAEARQACLDFMVRKDGAMAALRWDEMQLGGVSTPEDYRDAADRAGLMMSYVNYSHSWAVDLDDIRRTGDHYLDRLSANTRYQIRRSIRLYEKRGKLTATPAATAEEALEYYGHMRELHQRYWTGRGFPGSFASPFFERFHRALLTACVPTGTVELVCVRAGGVPIGYVYNFVHDGWVCAYQTGFRYEEDAKLKPGLVSHYLCISRHLAAGNRRYDFLAGGDRYKASLARRGPDIGTVVLQRPLLRLQIENAARALKREGVTGLRREPRLPLEPVPQRVAQRWPDTAARRRQIARGDRSGTRGKVLVLGDDTRSFLAIVRSLGRQGVEVHAAPASFGSLALSSRYIGRLHFLPFSMGDGQEWLQAMEALLRQEKFDMVIPCDETTLLPIQRYRARLAPLARLGIPSDRAIAVLFDKHRTRELAHALDVPVSPGRLPRADDTAEGVAAELGLPLVVKPRQSYRADKLHSRGKVRVVDTVDALAEVLDGLDREGTVYEGFVPGSGVGVSLLAHGGRVLQVFEHHRVRENVSGSYYRVSAALTPALLREASAIVAALDYTGVAMFEFRVAGDSHVLLEVNARPWGSMPLPVSLGVDFPYFWYRLLVEGVEVPRVSYRAGVYGRNLIPDFWSTVSEVRRSDAGVGGKMAMGVSRSVELGRALVGREVHDVLVRDDPGPGTRELWGTVRTAVGRLARAAPRAPGLRGFLARRRMRRALTGAMARPGGEVLLLFVCQGNICRSPFAEAALRARLPRGGAVEVASYGMLPLPGRPTPGNGLAAAAARGIDLRPHRSAHLTQAEAEAATVILIFDDINMRAVLDRYPGLRTPMLRLGDFARPPAESIDDPWGEDLATYEAAYATIARAVDGVVAVLADAGLVPMGVPA